jgi:hypothetical protein
MTYNAFTLRLFIIKILEETKDLTHRYILMIMKKRSNYCCYCYYNNNKYCCCVIQMIIFSDKIYKLLPNMKEICIGS